MITPTRSSAVKSGDPKSGRGRLILLFAIAALLVLLALFSWSRTNGPATRHYLNGMNYIVARRADLAEQEWLKGIHEAPRDPRCFEMLGNLYTSLHRPDAAAQCLGDAAIRDPGNGQTWLELAHAEQAVRDFSQGLIAAKHAADLRANDPDALFIYGAMLSQNKRWRSATDTLRRAYALSPRNSQLLLALASAEVDSLDFTAAETHLKSYLTGRPNDPTALFMLAVVYNQRTRSPANVQASILWAEKALQGMPRDIRIYTLLGQLYLDANRVPDALRIYQQGERIAPDSEENLHGLLTCFARLNRGSELEETGKRLEAMDARHRRVDHLKQVMGFQPGNASAALELAHLYETDQQYATALACFQQLAHRFPNNAKVQADLYAFQERTFTREGWKRTKDGWAPPASLGKRPAL